MKYLSTFSGIEAATVAWHPLGFQPIGFSEIESFPSEVLNFHYPTIKNYGDITKFKEWTVESFQLLVGGSPCQSFSMAGLRRGLNDPRGNLMLTYLALAGRFRPQWIVWENVSGVLSSNGGKDLATFFGALAEFGYGYAYRILNAQYVGTCKMHRTGRGWDAVPQRRRRIFVVAYLGDWRPPAAVLFDPYCLSGDTGSSEEKGKGNSIFASDGDGADISWGEMNSSSHAFKMRGGCNGGGKGYLGQDECAFTLSTHQDQNIAQAIPINTMAMMGRPSDDLKPRMGLGIGHDGDLCPTLTKAHTHAVAHKGGFDLSGHDLTIRRLTPIECERLQGFPDNYTRISWKGKDADQCPDGHRYKALGNSMAVNVMRWLGKRIQDVDRMINER